MSRDEWLIYTEQHEVRDRTFKLADALDLPASTFAEAERSLRGFFEPLERLTGQPVQEQAMQLQRKLEEEAARIDRDALTAALARARDWKPAEGTMTFVSPAFYERLREMLARPRQMLPEPEQEPRNRHEWRKLDARRRTSRRRGEGGSW